MACFLSITRPPGGWGIPAKYTRREKKGGACRVLIFAVSHIVQMPSRVRSLMDAVFPRPNAPFSRAKRAFFAFNRVFACVRAYRVRLRVRVGGLGLGNVGEHLPSVACDEGLLTAIDIAQSKPRLR